MSGFRRTRFHLRMVRLGKMVAEALQDIALSVPDHSTHANPTHRFLNRSVPRVAKKIFFTSTSRAQASANVIGRSRYRQPSLEQMTLQDTATRPLTNVPAAVFLKLYMNFIRKYVIYINCDALDEALEETLQLAYLFGARALQEHRRQGRNGVYETFAVELLALLQKYRCVYTAPPEAPDLE